MMASSASGKLELFVGTYSSPGHRGLRPLRAISHDRWELGPPEVMIENTSFAVYNPNFGLYYFINETDDGRIETWWRSEGGVWRHLGTVSSRGGAPCHVSIDHDGRRLAVANYKTGSVVLFELDGQTGQIIDGPSVYQNAGAGPNAERQEGPHAHCVRFFEGWLYSTDLGTDQIMAWPPGATLAVKPIVAFAAPSGEGPRHIIFHPSLPVAYLLTELGSKIFIMGVLPTGHLILRQMVSTLPDGFDGVSLGGHIEMNSAGNRLYVSNRGHDSLAVFEVSDDGDLALIGYSPTFGASPRHFLLLEDRRQIVVAHQGGNTVAVLAIADDGIPDAMIEVYPLHGPAFIGRVPTTRI